MNFSFSKCEANTLIASLVKIDFKDIQSAAVLITPSFKNGNIESVKIDFNNDAAHLFDLKTKEVAESKIMEQSIEVSAINAGNKINWSLRPSFTNNKKALFECGYDLYYSTSLSPSVFNGLYLMEGIPTAEAWYFDLELREIGKEKFYYLIPKEKN